MNETTRRTFWPRGVSNSGMGRRGREPSEVLCRSRLLVVPGSRPADLLTWCRGRLEAILGHTPAAKVLDSPAWAGVGNLESWVFWIRAQANQGWYWNAEAGLFGAHLGTPKVGLGAARMCFLGDREAVAAGTTREGHPGPQARQSLRPEACHAPGGAERAAGPGPDPESRAHDEVAQTLASPQQLGGRRRPGGWGRAGWGPGGPGGPEQRVALPVSPLALLVSLPSL